ncbi:hypothetical protein C0J26_11085 [Pseudomonas baetica]|nr:hypothetical protein C0J26_11085 [Pseudomonas baetica]
MGASLLAKASVDPASLLYVPASSRAGSLPQGFSIVLVCTSRYKPHIPTTTCPLRLHKPVHPPAFQSEE